MKQFIYATTFLTIMAAPVVQAAAVGDDEKPELSPVAGNLLSGMPVEELTEKVAQNKKKLDESLEKQEHENAALKKINELKETAVGILNSASEELRDALTEIDAMTEIADLPIGLSERLALRKYMQLRCERKKAEADKLMNAAKRLEKAQGVEKRAPRGGGESVSEDKRAVSGGS